MKHLALRTFVLIFLISTVAPTLMAQVPQMFNYQGVARDQSTGDPIENTTLSVRIAILSSFEPEVVIWEEEHSVTTNEFGLFTLKVGDPSASKTGGSLNSFSEIEWIPGNRYIRPAINYQGSWSAMEASQIITVPYALVAKKAETGQFPVNGNVIYLPEGNLAIGSDDSGGSKLAVVSDNDASEEALFEVKRADGQTVFAVYPEAVRVYVAKGDPLGKAPGTRGGFAVAGFDSDDKATPINDLLWLTPDSVRFYIDDTQTGKARTRGGFAVAGFDRDEKALGPQYLNISGSDIPDAIPPSSQILFYPRKDALLAGTIQVEDPGMVGLNSVSLGYLNTASGKWSQAIGYMSEATADYSMAVGKNAIANGNYSYAFGEGSIASGDNSYAMGQGASANSVNSMSLGFYSKAGSSSIALGKFAEATGSEAFSGGYNSDASGFQSTAVGPVASATHQGSTAIGFNASSTNSYSISLGYNASASGYGSTALGYYATSGGSYSTALAGSNASGAYSFASGLGTASGSRSFATGAGTASGNYTCVLGYNNQAQAYGAVVVGSGGSASGSPTDWGLLDPIFVVGNSNTAAPSNALTVLKNGSLYLDKAYTDAVGGTRKVLYVDSNGKIGVLSSSKRYKEDIDDVSDVDWLTSLRPVKFSYKSDPEKTRNYGLIAEEVLDVRKELVSFNNEGLPETVYYDKLLIPLLKMTQNQEEELMKKENRIAELEAENADIQARLDALEAAVSSLMQK